MKLTNGQIITILISAGITVGAGLLAADKENKLKAIEERIIMHVENK